MRMLNGGGKAAGLVLVLLLAGAGCSAAGGSRTASTTTREPDVATLWHELVVCARANGMPNLPDPQVDSNGEAHFPGGDPPAPPKSVERACRSVGERLAAARREVEQTPADAATLLRFARCMREHGLPDFPDPQGDGQFQFAGTNAGRELKQKDPASPVQTALRACGGPRMLNGRIADNG
jgi:hypothetical protein